MLKRNIKWTEIIHDETEIVKNSALYIIPVDDEVCRLIYVDDVGDRRELSAGIGSDKTFLYIQEIASNVWVINHGLKKRPTPTFHFPSGKVMGAVDYEHITNNQMIARFAKPEMGSVTLN